MPPLIWEPATHADYDTTFKTACDMAFQGLMNGGSATRRAFLFDPRTLHRKLYEPLTPPGFTEYGGTFRGTPGTSLAGREVQSPSNLGPGPYDFLQSAQVTASMDDLRLNIKQVLQSNLAPEDFAKAAGLIFFYFGYIHPFINGNGHIQRLMFAALIFERGLVLSPRWTIHERPYDRLFAIALELGVLHNDGSLAAEYLSLFVNP